MQVQDSEKTNANESCTQNSSLDTAYTSTVSVASVAPACNSTTTSPSVYSDNLALSRIGSVEISFQPQLGSEFSQTLAEFQNITGEKRKARPALPGNCDATAFIDRTFKIRA